MSHIKKLLDDKDKLDQLIRNAFLQIDTEKKGFLNIKEIEDVLINLANEMLIEEPNRDEIEELKLFMDPNNNQKLEYKEFYSMMRQVLELMQEEGDEDIL